MSLPLLLNLVEEACKTGSISTDTRNYLYNKCEEFGFDTGMVDKLIAARNVKIVEPGIDETPVESVLSDINASLRSSFSEHLSSGKNDLIIEYFEEKLAGTYDYFLIECYLKALMNNGENEKALTQAVTLSERIEPDLKKIFPTLGLIFYNNKEYSEAFKIYQILLTEGDGEAREKLDTIAEDALNEGEFQLLDLLREDANYHAIAKRKLNEFSKGKKYRYFIKLFETDFEDDENFVRDYLWALYQTKGTEEKGYERGKHYISLIKDPDSLAYVMGLICTYLGKWSEAYDYFKKSLSRGVDVQEDIDSLMDKLIDKNLWTEVLLLSDSKSYAKKLEDAFQSMSRDNNYEGMIGIFENCFPDTSDPFKVKKYVLSLSTSNPAKSLKKYLTYDKGFKDNDKYWLWLGGKVNEKNNNLSASLELYRKAEALEESYCRDDITRVSNLLHPDLYFMDLYKKEKYQEAIDLFEGKLSETSDIRLIENYVLSLFKNDGSEEKALETAILNAKNHPEGKALYPAIGAISKYFKKYFQSRDYYMMAKKAGYPVEEELQEIKRIIEKIDENEQRRKDELVEERIENEKQRREEERIQREEERMRREEEEEERLEARRQRKKQQEEEESEPVVFEEIDGGDNEIIKPSAGKSKQKRRSGGKSVCQKCGKARSLLASLNPVGVWYRCYNCGVICPGCSVGILGPRQCPDCGRTLEVIY